MASEWRYEHEEKSEAAAPERGAMSLLRRTGRPAPAAEIYHDDSRDDLLYVCRNYPRCNAYVRVQPGTKQPMGPLANGDLRHLRIRAHRAFDRVWQCGVMTRDAAYRWMADYFCIPLREAHIGQFSEYRCQQLIQKCEDLLWKTGKAS